MRVFCSQIQAVTQKPVPGQAEAGQVDIDHVNAVGIFQGIAVVQGGHDQALDQLARFIELYACG